MQYQNEPQKHYVEQNKPDAKYCIIISTKVSYRQK